MRKSWGYSLMCASVVALSVGLAVWVNTLLYSQMFLPLGLPGSERWYSVQIAPDATSRVRPSVDHYTWQKLMENGRAAVHLGAFANKTAVLSEGQASTSLRGTLITPRLLQGIRPAVGRMLRDSDAQPGAAPVALISHEAWQLYFGGDRNIAGRMARVDAAPVQIIGVLPEGFLVLDDYELWQPLEKPTLTRPQDSTLIVYPLIEVREGQNVAAIENEMKTVLARVNADHPDLFNAKRWAGLIPANRMFTHGAAPIVTMMSFMAIGVLLIGCVNISMVFLARLLERSRELALRTALGAARSRLLRQCLMETALIVVVGLIAGYVLATLGVEWTHGISSFGSRVLNGGRSTNVPMMRPFDAVAAIGFATMVWFLSTLIPAWRITRQDPAVALAGSGKGVSVRSRNRSVGFLVGLQVVVSCLVLVMCGNVVTALQRETAKPNGLEIAGVMLSTDRTVFDARYKQPAQRLRYWEDLTASIESKVPGASAAFTTAPPTRPVRVAMTVETQQRRDKEGALTLPLTVVSDNYFQLMGVRLRSGRLFDGTDTPQSLPVAVVDEKMAARFWPDGNVLGKRIRLNSSAAGEWLTIVGVVSAVRGAPYRADADLGSLYQPLRQTTPEAFHILVKAAGDRRREVRAAAYAVDRDLPLHNLQPVHDYMAAINLSYPAMTKCFIAIALITALLAASGLFGLISRSVAQRTQEVGIRRALGATPWRAASMFLRQGAIYLSVAAIGLALGILMMPALSRAIPNILEQVVPVTAAVVVLMAAVISTASYLPTRRAVALEPGDALRYE
ncbi:MAG TPA: FtsX-like permease family protein [Thermoanaerobaculia bacterium]|nr:FtsX-like permease family protein [Thermoanaerobaculia bacterium]